MFRLALVRGLLVACLVALGNAGALAEGTNERSVSPTKFFCPSPIFGELLWSGNQARCLKGFALMPGWRFRMDQASLICVRCPKNCVIEEQPDQRYLCVSRRPPSSDSLLGQTWTSAGEAPQATMMPFESPRTEEEVRRVLEGMGFQIVENATFGAFDGYRARIVDPVKAAQFGFKAREQLRAAEGGQVLTSTISCWKERQGDHFIIWIDWREVDIRDESALPPYVRLYAK